MFERLYDVKPVEGRLSDLAAGDVAVESTTAVAQGLRVGDRVTVTFGRTGDVLLTVRAIFDQALEGVTGNDWIVDVADVRGKRHAPVRPAAVRRRPGRCRRSPGRRAIDATIADWPGADVQDQAEYKQAITDEIDKVLNLVYVLLALAIVIAVLGIAKLGAVSSTNGRRRDRSAACDRHDTRTGAGSGPLGIVDDRLVRDHARSRARGRFCLDGGAASATQDLGTVAVPYQRLLAIAIIATLAGLAASLAGRRAARMDVLAAIAAP